MVYGKYSGNDSRFTSQQLAIMNKKEQEEKRRQQEAEKEVKESKEKDETSE